MRCDSLKSFQDELEVAVNSLRSAKGPIRIREIDISNTRLESAHVAFGFNLRRWVRMQLGKTLVDPLRTHSYISDEKTINWVTAA